MSYVVSWSAFGEITVNASSDYDALDAARDELFLPDYLGLDLTVVEHTEDDE